MTYYKIKKYLMKRGLTEGQADRVRGMIREMINEGGHETLRDFNALPDHMRSTQLQSDGSYKLPPQRQR